jgi:glycosyltransferase involved in cell wall biosynthesis
VFPLVRDFLEDYLRSLAAQTTKDFDLVVFNDGFDGLDEFLGGFAPHVIVVPCSGSPASVRKQAIEFMRQAGYERIIFTDADDTFAPNRVEVVAGLLHKHDIVLNDLTVVERNGACVHERYLSRRLDDGARITLEYILDKNVFGLSNTGVRIPCIPGDLTLPENLVAVDWYLFSLLLAYGADAVFTSRTETFYRMHGNNTIGLGGDIATGLDRGIAVKQLHYRLLSWLGPEYADRAAIFADLANKMIDLSYRSAYLSKLKNIALNDPLWWETFRTAEELDL